MFIGCCFGCECEWCVLVCFLFVCLGVDGGSVCVVGRREDKEKEGMIDF